jgi:hypothetical protein
VQGEGIPCNCGPDVVVRDSGGTELPPENGLHNFGDVLDGLSRTETFTVANDAPDTLIVSGLAIEDDTSQPGDFAFVGASLPLVVPGMDSDTLDIRFTSAAPFALKDAGAVLTTNDPDKPIYRFRLRARAQSAPDIRVEVDAVEQPNGSSVDFGDAEVEIDLPLVAGEDYIEKSLTIVNEGSAALDVSSCSPGGDPDFAIDFAPVLLNPTQSAVFTVTFTPQAVGARTATLSLASDDPDESPYVLTLTGNGIPDDD